MKLSKTLKLKLLSVQRCNAFGFLHLISDLHNLFGLILLSNGLQYFYHTAKYIDKAICFYSINIFNKFSNAPLEVRHLSQMDTTRKHLDKKVRHELI